MSWQGDGQHVAAADDARGTAEPAVSVIVPARDAAPTIERTLEALKSQDLATGFEVIVVDDGSRDGTPELVSSGAPWVTVLRNAHSEGPGAARNRGAATARAQVLAFTDSDCFPTPEWLRCGLRGLADVDLVQGRVEPDPAEIRRPFDRTLSVEDDGGFYQTANLFVRREVFEGVGGFRDWALEQPGRRRWSADRRRGRAARTPIGEDSLFAWTARRRGARSAFASDAVVHHAVVPGGIYDDAQDRWHWAQDMPGLIRLVPELRVSLFYRRWFFSRWTARYDLAAAALLLAVLTGRKWWMAFALPYGRCLLTDCRRYRRWDALRFVVGVPVVDGVTLAALLRGSMAWRRVVL